MLASSGTLKRSCWHHLEHLRDHNGLIWNIEDVSILSIFPLPSHSSRIFFRVITNGAQKRWTSWDICNRWDSVLQVKRDGPWNKKNVCRTVKKYGSAIRAWISAKIRKIIIRFFTKLAKTMCNTWNRFWKSLKIIQGPGILKVHAQQCHVTNLYTFSQEAGALLFYIH